MNTHLIEQLLNESESDYLDFKRDQYPFDGSADEVKGELLKDILAFTNAWRRTDAYILIGVEEVKGSRNKVVGISKHLEDSFLQQFVNSKTQRPITFSYIPTSYEERQIGVIKIPVQFRPVYLTKDFGKLKKHVVYLRRGSATVEAAPDEIAQMGAADFSKTNDVDVNLEFADLYTRTLQGNSIAITSKVLSTDNEQIPNFSGEASNSFEALTIGSPNKRYYKELVKYFDERFLLCPIGFAIINRGQTALNNVRVVISVDQTSNLELLVANNLSDIPKKYFSIMELSTNVDTPSINKSNLTLEKYNNKKVITIEFGNLQPKVVAWSDEEIFFGSRDNKNLEFGAQIFANELQEPVSIRLSIQFETEAVNLNLQQLGQMLKTKLENLYNEDDN